MEPNQLTLDIYVNSGNAMLSRTDSITIFADCSHFNKVQSSHFIIIVTGLIIIFVHLLL